MRTLLVCIPALWFLAATGPGAQARAVPAGDPSGKGERRKASTRGKRTARKGKAPTARQEKKNLEKQARKTFEAGKRAYYLRRFDEAAKLFARAYELLPMPEFLLNLGQCHRMLGNYERAIFFYRMYLDTSDATGREQIQRIIVDCREKLKQQKRKEAEEARKKREAERKAREREAERRRKQAERVRRLEAERRAAAAAAAAGHKGPGTGSGKPFAPALPGPRKGRTGPFYRKWWFWTSVAAGVVAATVTGLAVGLSYRTVLPSGNLGTLDAR